MDRQCVRLIQKFIKNKKQEEGIYQKVVKEDVFDILQGQCTVLYYNLDDAIDGCHINKPMHDGSMRPFVFINTEKNVQEQVWSAAHELGHVWEVDAYVRKHMTSEETTEDIVSRFAAEFMMPEKEFAAEIHRKLNQFSYTGKSMPVDMMMELIAYLMNTFCTPYKSIVKRFIEMGYVKSETFEVLDKYRDSENLNRVIQENQYSRLGKERPVYAIENFPKDLQIVEEKQLMGQRKIEKIREIMHIEKAELGEEQVSFNYNS